MPQKLSIIFFGSGPVALKSLELLKSDFSIEAIITKSATKASMEHVFPTTPTYSVENRAELTKLFQTLRPESKIAILIDFGVIVGQDIIDVFPLGIVNSHFSLLPQWRGADPITFAILSGQKQTGVSLMLLTKGMDEGPILSQATFNIEVNATTPELTTDLIALSDKLLKTIVPEYVRGAILPTQQAAVSPVGSTEASYSRKLTKEDGRLDWTKPAHQLEREIRAYGDWPHSYTKLAGRDVTITQAQVLDETGKPGTISKDKKRLVIYCEEQALQILTLKPAGKPEMTATAFLAGYGRLLDN